MAKGACEVCGYQSERRDIKKYDVVPSAIMREVGRKRSIKILLCNNCHEEFDELCSKVIADMTYDTCAKRFKPKSPQEMVKEYEIAYQRFSRYKKEQQKKLRTK